MLVTQPFDLAVAARMAEFWAWFTPWHRRSWNVGTVAAIREILEASESLSRDALKSVQAEVIRLVGPDNAVGDETIRATLARLLRADIVYGRFSWHQLSSLLVTIDADYLKRWSDLMRTGEAPGIERVARSVAGHLLTAGFSPTYLHRWLRYQTSHGTESLSMADVVEQADGLAKRPSKEYKVVLPVITAPEVRKTQPAEWLSADQTSHLIASIQGSRPDVRQNGGFALSVRAKDPFVAVERARELLERWDARAELALRDRIVRTEKAWVEGYNEPIPFAPRRRHVGIGALVRQGIIYAPLEDADDTATRIDDALQLVQPMAAGHRSAAISGGWAAIESLLTEAGEPENLAAPRLSAIIACSFPRAELTTLSFLHGEQASDSLADSLADEGSNLKRARLMADAILRGDRISGKGPQDEAAVERMRELLVDPHATLERVRGYVQISLDRLYRQRNLILHGGRVTGDGRLEALATAPPLVGAGLDRIVDAWFTDRTRPIELAARAKLGIDLVGTPGGRRPIELLESS